MSTPTTKVLYTFAENSLTVEVIVSTQLQKYVCADGKTEFPGFAIQGGKGQYESGTSKHTVVVSPQSVNPYNVLWAGSTGGLGGSQDGIDTNGINFQGDNGQLSWNGTPGQFWMSAGGMNQAVTLQGVQGWPPR
jgi:hypothetical protein